MYLFCSNNPIIFIDPTGHWQQGDENLSHSAQNAIKYYDNLIKSTENSNSIIWIKKQQNELRNKASNNEIKYYKKLLNNTMNSSSREWIERKIEKLTHKGTGSIGLNAQIQFYAKAAVSIELACDNNGNAGLLLTIVPLSGGGTPNMGVSVFSTQTNAENLFDLRSWSSAEGGSTNAGPINAGIDYIRGGNYSGQKYSIGFKALPAVEGHVERSFTFMHSWKKSLYPEESQQFFMGVR